MTDKEMAEQSLLEANLEIITSPAQEKQGRMMVLEPLSGDRFTLSPKTGWVRIYPERYRGGFAHTYQINKKEVVVRVSTYGPQTFYHKGYDRIMLYNFTEMAERVLDYLENRQK
jgi:hypothetical protein